MSIVRASSEGVESTANPAGKYVSQSGVLAGTTPITDVPDTPTIGTATDVGTSRAFNNGAATVTVTPAVTGGVPASYTVTSSPGNYSATSTSPVTVTGLQSTTSYTFTAVANATAGSSPVTASASNSITATTVPDIPNIGTATDIPSGRGYNNGRIDVGFTAPSSNGGKAITGYTATSSPGGYTGTGSSSPISITGLQSATAYTFTVTATNANGTSLVSNTSNSATATTVPQAPTINSVTVTNSTTVTLNYSAGATGGSAITSYTVTSSPSIALTYNSSNPTTLTGTYAEGQSYTFTMTATNANGTSLSSNTSSSVVPKVTPGGQTFLASGTFTVPAGVTSISAVAIGGGQSGSVGGTPDGGTGGSLRYSTSIATTPGESLTITVGSGGVAVSTTRINGGNSSIARGGTNLLLARGGGQTTTEVGTGFAGGAGQVQGSSTSSGGAGGAAGYAGNGGAGGASFLPAANSGAAAGSDIDVQSNNPTYGAVIQSVSIKGGGVGPWGTGYTPTATAGDYGSGGFRSLSDTNSKVFGSGGGSQQNTTPIVRNNGGDGVVRIIWGDGRSYPSTNVTLTPTLVGYVSGSNVGTNAISYPAGTAQGDLLVFIQSDGAGAAAPAAPTNWTAPRAMRSTSPSCATFWKIAGTETSVNPATSISATGNYIIAAFRNIYLDGRSGNVDVQGGKNLRGADQYAVQSPGSGMPIASATTAVRIQVPNAITIVTAAIDDIVVSGPGAPSGWTFVGYQQSATTSGGASMMAYKIHSSHNDTTIATAFSGSGNDTSSSVTWTFRPGEYTTT